jgi:hypothetical protein
VRLFEVGERSQERLAAVLERVGERLDGRRRLAEEAGL